MHIDIRPAQAADIPGCLAISNAEAKVSHANLALQDEPLDQWIADFNRGLPWYVAIHEDEVVGFARATPWRGRGGYDHCAEVSVYLHERWRREGLGRRLYAALLPAAARSNLHVVIAAIGLPNEASVALHETLGFTHTGTFSEVGRKFDRWWDVGYWSLELADA